MMHLLYERYSIAGHRRGEDGLAGRSLLKGLLLGGLAGEVRLGIVAVLQEDVLDHGLADSVSEVDAIVPDSGATGEEAAGKRFRQATAQVKQMTIRALG